MSRSRQRIERAKRAVADRMAGIVRREIAEAGLVPRHEVEALQARVAWLENEMNRLGPHVAAQGERLGVVEQGYRPVPDPETMAAAVEHARARARGALVSEYEERINRLEVSMEGLSRE